MTFQLSRDQDATRPLRVLLVNDSATVRASLRIGLEAHPNIEVIGEVDSGAAAPAETARLRPSIVLMDVVMPGCNGYEATRSIMATAPTPVVMISAVENAKEESVVLRALGAGALSIVQLPGNPLDPANRARWAGLVQLLRTMAGANVGHAPSVPAPAGSSRSIDGAQAPATGAGAAALGSRINAIAVVASAGGPQALAALLTALRGRPMPPLLLVQHMAVGFSVGFAQWLGTETGYRVQTARHGERMQPGVAYLPPEDRHLGVAKGGTLVVSDAPAVRRFRPSADFLISSLAQAFGGAAAAIVLTGMGSDGARGAADLHSAGGIVVAEASESAIIDGMPRAVRERNAATRVLALNDIPQYLSEITSTNPKAEARRDR